MTKARIDISADQLAAFCRQNGILRLSFFGSVLTDDFGPHSDVDVLVEFKPGSRIGLIRLSQLEHELGDILGRNVDLSTPGFLSKYFRSTVMAESEVLFAEA